MPWIDPWAGFERVLLLLRPIFALWVVWRQGSLPQVRITAAAVGGTLRSQLLAGPMAELRLDFIPVLVDHGSVIGLVTERGACFR